ncbi:hemicentin-1-like [Haliotis rubra]|uniref:hemicentin-1-like n=1 Tax=Haliotis rubra TaxID=36100 RepID=UPI001EE5DF80|nr:hemicentin-1-like [Haliotis rubra]
MTSRTVPSLLLGLTMVLCLCSLSTAQIFTKPFLSMQTPMTAGTSYTLSCSSIANGAQITYVWQRGDELSPFTTSTSCTIITTSAQGIVSYECVSAYQLTARREDNGVNITCTASLPTGRTNSDTGTFYIQIPPPSQYPEIIGADTINEGQNVTYLCVADGAVPQATLRWRVRSVLTDGYSPPATVNGDGTFRTVNYLYRLFTAADDGIRLDCDMSHPATSGRRVTKTVTVQYKPTVSSSPSTYTLTEGVTGNLHCSYASMPSPTTVRWVKDNQVLDRSSGRFLNGDTPTSPTLIINNPQAEDAGTYVCIVSNVVGEGSGPSVTVVVRSKVTIPNASYGADISESLTIPCIIDADPTVTSVTWYRTVSGSTLPVTISGSKYGGGTVATPAMTIFNLLPSDAGSYQCEAGNGLGTTPSNAVSVSISYAPTNIRAVPNAFEVDAGGDVLVTCIADAVPSPTYAWFFETDSTNPVSSSSALNITASTPFDNGRYTCKATNEKGQASVIVGISVRFPPIINTSSSPQDIDEGSSVTLLCSVYANPIPFGVTWFKNSQFLNRTNPGYSGGNSVASPHLTIANIQKNDAGSYYCEVPNQMGRTRSKSVIVRVVYPPSSIAITPSGAQTLNEGDSLTLICLVNAVPMPNYEWRTGNEVITSAPILVINSARPDDNRDVTCVGSNSKGNITETVRVNVEYAPRVTIPGGDAFGADEGNALSIPCVVDANPAVNTFQWLKDSAVLDLSDTSKYSGGTSASTGLTILALSSADAGNYSCSAGNPRGQATSRDVLVTISYQPENVTVSQTSVTVVENEAILVTCSGNAVPSPSFNWLRGGVEYQDGVYLNITSATPEDSGTYTCKVNNTKGTAEVSILVDVQYFPRVSSPDEPLIADTGDTVTIPCTIDANPNVTAVTWNMLNGSSQQPVDMSDSRYTGSTPGSPSMSIDSLTPEDAGRYQCNCENAIGTGSGSYVTLTITFVPKEVSLTPSKVNVTEGETISVTCSSSAAPSATYVWLRNGDFYQNGATLSISSASTEDNATFMCQATNVKGTTSSSIDINVSYRPRGILKNSIVTTTIGNSATLTCQTRANPPTSSYTWSFGSTQLAETGASLKITPTTVDDFGQYTCVARNTIGSSEPINLDLQQETTPSPPNTGASTAALGTEIIVLIVIVVLILLIIIIVIIIVCYKKGKCGKKKETKGRVAPVVPPLVAKTEATPTAVETSSTDPEKPSVRPRPQWSAVSRQDVHVNVNNHVHKEHDKMSVEDETAGNGTIPNGAPAGGPIISIKDPDDTPRAHHLPPLHYGGGDNGEENAEERRRRRRKKRRKRQDEGETTEQPKSDTIDEEEE